MRASSPVDRLSTLSPSTPVLRSMAISSALLRLFAPSALSLSRGRSPWGRSRIIVEYSRPPWSAMPSSLHYFVASNIQTSVAMRITPSWAISMAHTASNSLSWWSVIRSVDQA